MKKKKKKAACCMLQAACCMLQVVDEIKCTARFEWVVLRKSILRVPHTLFVFITL